MARMAFALFIALFTSALSFSDAHQTDSIQISQPWARVSAPGAPSAGFIVVTNSGSEDDILLSVAGDFADRLELHRTQEIDGVMKMMHQKNGIVIPAGGQVVFQPGSYHLMFMGLSRNFELGERYSVELTFKRAGTLTIELPVQQSSIMMDGAH